jgi:carbamoylphosphate synthase small subunit
MINAALVLEDESIWTGRGFGARRRASGEVVFNTGMVGYVQSITDPSYRGQILCQTYPLVGNYGVSPEEFESDGPQITGYIVSELCKTPSHYTSRMSLDDWLEKSGVPGISGVDTRELTKVLRSKGTMLGILEVGHEPVDTDRLLEDVKKVKDPNRRDLVGEVTVSSPRVYPALDCRGFPGKAGKKSDISIEQALELIRRGVSYGVGGSGQTAYAEGDIGSSRDGTANGIQAESAMRSIYGPQSPAIKPIQAGISAFMAGLALDEYIADPIWKSGGRIRVVVLDCGVKLGIIRSLQVRGADVIRIPAGYGADNILALDPDGIMISNGPGDPKKAEGAAAALRRLAEEKIPIFGVCLGNQILALALGGDTYKLKFGHRGQNHPAVEKSTGRLAITSQNHGFAVDPGSVEGTDLRVTFTNCNDGTVEGIAHRTLPISAVQFHPEARPGPLDTGYLFDNFLNTIKRKTPCLK